MKFKKIFSVVFLVCAFSLLLIPSVCVLWAPTMDTTENRTLAAAPTLQQQDGSFNVNILSDSGSYFEDHFAFRNNMVQANAQLHAALGTSSSDQVVVGQNDWLFYSGTLFDYLGQSHLSDRSLRTIAHNLSLVQRYVKAQGGTFVFTIAPNKNTLYAQNMPLYYVQSTSQHNAQRLKPYLESYGVNYVDLFDAFNEQDETLYLKHDSHWNNTGAGLAANELLTSGGHDQLSLGSSSFLTVDDSTGDLAAMLYPADAGTEPNQFVQGIHPQVTADDAALWKYTEGSDVTDDWIRTEGSGRGSALIFRDSFGNTLLPYMATAYNKAAFSKLVPYNIAQMNQLQADTVVIERAERHLAYLANNAPIVPALKRSDVQLPAAADARAQETTCSLTTNGPYTVLSGSIAQDERAGHENADILVAVTTTDGLTTVYEAFSETVQSSTLGNVDFDEFGGGVDAQADDFGYRVFIGSSAGSSDIAQVAVFLCQENQTFGMRIFDTTDLQS